MYRHKQSMQRDFVNPKKDSHPKWKKRKPSFGNFGSYCSQLMRHSLITGFPVIAASKSSVRRVIKLMVLLVCTAGFLYQTYYFLEMYLAYPTILNINVLNPEIVDAPAVTVCNRNRLRRTEFCKIEPDKCEWKYGNNTKDFCRLFPTFCPQGETIFTATVDRRAVTNQNRSFSLLEAAGQRKTDLVKDCVIISSTERLPCSTITLVQATREGSPNNCYAIQSLWGKPDEESFQIPLTGVYQLMLTMHPEEYFSNGELIQAYVYVHDPHSAANPMADGVTLMAGQRYKLYVHMNYRESLPPPYKTNCTDYMKKWRENGGYGPITKRACTEQCKVEAMVQAFGCVGQSLTYPNNYTICNNIAIEPSKKMIDKCSNDCNDPCEESVYFTTTELTEDLSTLFCKDPENLYCKFKYLIVTVSFSRMVITKFKHEPKFQSVEMFSYIGGYMGMWLGISLVSLFDFVEMLADVLAYPVMRWRKNRMNIGHVEHMQQRSMFNMYDM